MIHPSYTELMEVINEGAEIEDVYKRQKRILNVWKHISIMKQNMVGISA